jgi:hypothetical protein
MIQVIGRRASIQLSALPPEPLADPDFVISSRKNTNNQAQEMLLSEMGQQCRQKFKAEHCRQTTPFELRDRRIFRRQIEVFQRIRSRL